MLGSVCTPSPERGATAGAAVAADAAKAPGAPRKPRPRAARHREIHRRVVRRLHSALERLASAGDCERAERAERADDGATMSPEDSLGGCIAAVEEAKTLARRFSTNARELSETLQREAVRAEVRIAEELERAVARAAARAAARAPEGPLAAAEAVAVVAVDAESAAEL
jgi:hypothetical protein